MEIAPGSQPVILHPAFYCVVVVCVNGLRFEHIVAVVVIIERVVDIYLGHYLQQIPGQVINIVRVLIRGSPLYRPRSRLEPVFVNVRYSAVAAVVVGDLRLLADVIYRHHN